MSLSNWFELGRLIASGVTAVVSIVGFIGVIWTIRQKTASDNRTEWWKRYTWAEEQLNGDYRQASRGWIHLNILLDSDLATTTEIAIIEALSMELAEGDNEESREDDSNDNHTG